MQRRSATTGLMVNASRVLHKTVGVLSNTERGAAIVASGHASRRVASWRTRASSSRLEFVRFPSGFLSEIIAVMISGGQGCRHTRLVPDLDGFIHTHPPLPLRNDSRDVAESQLGRFLTDNIR